MLKRIPLLMQGILTKRLSISRAATFVRLSAGCLSERDIENDRMGEDMKGKALITIRIV